ncbi:phenylalanine--tRNA ligase subunit beta [Spirosoma areae]
MKISINCLRNYINLPENVFEVQEIMEDIGLEVKKVENSEKGTLFTLELLANRGDHHCYVGLAREIHGRTGWEMCIPPMHVDRELNNLNKVDVQTDKCFNYVLTELRKKEVDKLDLNEEKKLMLEVAGINLISPIVDSTNFITIEIGQPLHAFDADKVKGKIQVREADNGEKARLVFSEDFRDVPNGTIVIADEEKILAIAGVIGCEESKPTEATTRIYIESATFDPDKVRKSARYFGIQSYSSVRFEKGADPALAIGGAKRAVDLLSSIGWEMNGPISIEKEWDFPIVSIELQLSEANEFFGTQFSWDHILSVLERYGFGVLKNHSLSEDNYLVSVPSHRMWDVIDVKALYEEIAKGIGYNSLPSSLPFAVESVQPKANLKRKEKVEVLLIGEGFYEVFTDGFYSEAHRTKMGIKEGHPLWDHVGIANAGNRSYALLKNNSLAQAMELVLKNIHIKNHNSKAFEWTRIFKPNKSADNGLCDEQLILSIIAYGKNKTPGWDSIGTDVDVYYMKGLVEEMSNLLSIQLDINQIENDNNIAAVGTCLHPSRRASILFEGKPVGVIGEVHPRVISSWGIKSGRPCFIELSQEIVNLSPSERIYIPPSNLQTVSRDISLLLPKRLQTSQIVIFFKEKSSWISSVDIRSVFNSAVTGSKNAVTFSLTFSLDNAYKDKFTNEEINLETERLTEEVLKKYMKFHIERR